MQFLPRAKREVKNSTMNLLFDTKLAHKYSSISQKIRILTENWAHQEAYCPNCGHSTINKYGNNNPVGDFFCPSCKEDFELKSKKNSLGSKIVDGAYSTMIERLKDTNNPNFFLLNYNLSDFSVMDFFVVPKHFFVPNIIEKRRALSQKARRAGWVGCNILLSNIPQNGKIFLVKNKIIEQKEKVIRKWKKTLFLKEEKEISAKSWLLDIMLCVDKINKKEFTLKEIYSFEKELSLLHSKNKHIKEKVRQQLQILRDKGYLDFVSRGYYRLT